MFSTPATGLVQDPVTKEILGVKAQTGVTFASPPSYSYTGGTEVYVKAAKGVIMACGGYENNPEMSLNFLPGAKSNFVTPMGSPYNTGDGIGIVTSAGAKLWHMNSGEVYELAIKPASQQMGSAVMVTEVNSSPLSLQMILVNRYGQRFMNEALYWTHTKKSLAVDYFKDDVPPTDPDDYCDYPNIPFWMIVDDARVKAGVLGIPSYGQQGYSPMVGWLGTHNIYQWSSDNSAEIAKGWVVKADTIQALGSLLNTTDFFGRPVSMDAAALATTVTNYNNYCAAGNDPDFGRNPKTMTPIQTPPYYAMEICMAMLNTNGGPVRNQYAQTTDVSGNVIPRLYSAGEFGSIYGFLYQGAGNLPEAYGMGRVAGTHASAETPWS